jgi:hypothetical protein
MKVRFTETYKVATNFRFGSLAVTVNLLLMLININKSDLNSSAG